MNSSLTEKDERRDIRRRIIISIVGGVVITALLIWILIWIFASFTENFSNQVDAIPEICTAEEFEETIADGSGDYLVCGTMTVENPVTSSITGGEYIYLTEETLVKTLKLVGRNTTKYVWESAGSETQMCDSVVFLGVEIPVSAFVSAEGSGQIDTIEAAGNTKYSFYGLEATGNGTLDVTISDGEIVSVNGFYPDAEPAEVKDLLKGDEGVIPVAAVFATALLSLLIIASLFRFAIMD